MGVALASGGFAVSSVIYDQLQTAPARPEIIIDGDIIIVRIFHNRGGFQTPCITRLLPNGTAVSPCPAYYAVQVGYSTGLRMGWLDFEGRGYHLNLTSVTNTGTMFVSHLQLPNVWGGGDTLRTTAWVCRAATGRCDVLDLGLRTVEDVAWPPEWSATFP